MNPEALENLLIDRALGHLLPEVEALLDEHLATTPSAARAAAELREVVALATAALARPQPKLDLPARVVALPRWPRTRRALAMAASFAVGAGVMFLAVREPQPRPEIPLARATQPGSALVQTAPRSPEVERALRKLPFWSKERAYLLAGGKIETQP